MKIKFDFLTLTSKKATLRAFFFFLVRKSPFRFSFRSKFMKIGGPTYKGWAFQGGPETFFIGQRRNTRGFEYIITMPGEICNLFVFDFLKNSNLLGGEWRITRLDLQLTLDYEFASANQLIHFYLNFYKNQRALTKKIKFTANDEYLLLSVGSKKQRQTEWKVYTSELDEDYPKKIAIRFEVTIKNSSQYLNCLGKSGGCIEKCNFRIIQRTLLQAVDTFLLSKHRSLGSLVQDWSCYFKAQKELEKTKPTLALTAHQTKQEFRHRGSEKPREATRGSRKSRFFEELGLVAKALQSFAKMVKLKRQTFSHKQVKFLNDQLSSQDWRISWNIRKEWAIIPRESNPLWPSLFAPLPKKASSRRKAILKRQNALKSLAAHFNKVVRQCCQLPNRKMAYIEEPKANKLIREIFKIVLEYPVMDKSSERLPRAKALYSKNFEDQTDYVQDIIRTRQREKYKKKMQEGGGNIISPPPQSFFPK